MSANLSTVLQELLQNTTNLKVLRQTMRSDATYIWLNIDNPELRKVIPWACIQRVQRVNHNIREVSPGAICRRVAVRFRIRKIRLDSSLQLPDFNCRRQKWQRDEKLHQICLALVLEIWELRDSNRTLDLEVRSVQDL